MSDGESIRKESRELPHRLNLLSETIIGAAIEVHRALGPGLLERLYEEALLHELHLRRLQVDRQVPVALVYKGAEFLGQRLDLVVEGSVVVELKAIEKILEVHLAQLTGYLRAGAYPLGLLLNFNVPVLVKGVYRRINSLALPTSIDETGIGVPPARSVTGSEFSATSANPLRPLRTPPC